MRCRSIVVLFVIAVISCGACNNGITTSHGPIIMGNPNTIVTDSNAADLQDFVPDLKPVPASEATDHPDTAKTETTAPAETTPAAQQQPTAATPPPAIKDKGLKVIFNEVTLNIPNISTRGNKTQAVVKANGATYQMASGNLNGNELIVAGNVTRVSQRYQTMVVVKNGLGLMQLSSLMTTTNWQPMKGDRNGYKITGLDPSRLAFPNVRPAAIREAILREARKHRMDRKRTQDWVNSVRNVRAANQKPCLVMLRSVEWKIEGKDAKGKAYQKQLRLDMPSPQ